MFESCSPTFFCRTLGERAKEERGEEVCEETPIMGGGRRGLQYERQFVEQLMRGGKLSPWLVAGIDCPKKDPSRLF